MCPHCDTLTFNLPCHSSHCSYCNRILQFSPWVRFLHQNHPWFSPRTCLSLFPQLSHPIFCDFHLPKLGSKLIYRVLVSRQFLNIKTVSRINVGMALLKSTIVRGVMPLSDIYGNKFCLHTICKLLFHSQGSMVSVFLAFSEISLAKFDFFLIMSPKNLP